MFRIAYWLAALTASLILLAACSSPNAPKSAADGSGSPVVAAGASGSPEAVTPAPSGSSYSVRIGPFTQAFSTPLPTDPAQARVVADFRTAMVLWSRSNEALHLVAPVTGYVTGKALSDLNAALKTSQEHGYVPAGTDRLFDTKVTQISGTTATISTCDDGSQYRTMNLSTGQDLPPPSASQQYLLEIWGMVLMSGHWGISDLNIITLPDHRAAACQP